MTESQKTGLQKELGLVGVFSIATGAMISSGLFVLPGVIYRIAGPAAVLAYVLAGILTLPALFCKAELVTAMPKAGGDYFFIERSLGPAFGTLGGIASWFSLSLKSAFALFGIGAFGLLLEPVLPVYVIKLIAVFCCLALTLVNIAGVKHAGRFQVTLVMTLLAGLLVYVGRGFNAMDHLHFENFMGKGWRSVWTATGMVFVSYGGLTKVASIAEEVKDPGKTLPRGMFLAFSIVTLLYIVVVLITVGILGPQMSGDWNSLVHGAAQCLSLPGMILVAAMALLAYITTGNAGIMSASRIPLAMSRDQLLPERFSYISTRRGIPVPAVWFTSLFMIAAILFLDLEMLVKTASTMKIMLFLLVCLAVILMRESHIENYRPEFHTPLYPYIPLLGILAYFILIFEMGPVPLLLTAGFFGGGLLWYAFYGRIRSNREFALIRIAQRLLPSTLSPGTQELEDELREILRARDDIVEDRFDRLILECSILDMHEAEDANAFFRQASDALAERVQLPAEKISKLLQEREKESSTVIKPGLAIPHIVIPGENEFHVVLVRSREGIRFPEQSEPVHAAFVLAGSEDMRNYHLRVLMFIAQITQQVDFEKRWLQAADTATLRNLILLSKRTREPNDAGLLGV